MINEGLIPHILDYLVLPLVSIDEYHSKIDDSKCVVVVLFCPQKEPALDLSKFIEKSDLNILDTEVSPAPNPHGFYLVFVELLRNLQLPDTIVSLLQQINNLTNVKSWHFRGYHMDDHENYSVEKEELEKWINLDPKAIDLPYTGQTHTNENIGMFFSNSLLESVAIDSNQLFLNSSYSSRIFDIKKFGYVSNNDLNKCALDFTFKSDSKLLERELGPEYEVNSIQDDLIVIHDNQYLILKPLDN